MTHSDLDPAHAPKAIPVLGYERQTDDLVAIWVVRFVGVWIVSFAAAALLSRALQLYFDSASGFGWRGIRFDAELLTILAAIALGTAIIARRRFAFYSMLALVTLLPFIYLIPRISVMTFNDWLHMLPDLLIMLGVLFAALLSMLGHADARGALLPARTSRPPASQTGDSITFLTSRIGWICLGCSASGAMSWQGHLADGRFVAYAVCGVLLCAKRAWALWLLVAMLPLGLYAQLVQYWPATFLPQHLPRSSALQVSSIIVHMGGLDTVTQTCLLCLLARKARHWT